MNDSANTIIELMNLNPLFLRLRNLFFKNDYARG